MEKNQQDEIRILHEETKKRVVQMLLGRTLRADLFDEFGRERLLRKGQPLTAEAMQELPFAVLVRAEDRDRRRRPRAGSAGHRGAHRAPGRGHPPDLRGEEGEGAPRRRAAARRHQAGQGLRRDEAQAAGRRQDGRPARQQGRHRPRAARGGHAVPARRHAGGDRAQPAGRALAHERRADPRDPPRVGRARPRPLLRHAGVRRRDRSRDHQLARQGRPGADRRQDPAARRPDRRPVRAAGDRRLHLHAEALATWSTTRSTPGRSGRTRSSPSSRWAARRSSAASASARWRCGRSRPTAPRTSSRNC